MAQKGILKKFFLPLSNRLEHVYHQLDIINNSL